MTKVQTTSQASPRCTLCPAVCPLAVVQTAPDRWRMEYPLGDGGCLCPRGSALGDLLAHPRRILGPRVRQDGRWRSVSQGEAIDRVLAAAGGKGMTILLDGNLPCEQITAAAAWCKAWKQARLSLVIEPADEQLLHGTEASGAEYLTSASLGSCDGFLVIGGALAANPACSRGLWDRRKAEPFAPLAVIDPGAGVAAKFATHRVDCPPGGELGALLAVASAAGADVGEGKKSPSPSAQAAGEALSGCKRLGVLIAAEYGRNTSWFQIGLAAGKLAKAKGGAVAVQTAGANALAAVRMAATLGTIPLAEALVGAAVRVAVGCDVLGLLGWAEGDRIQAAAAAMPNRTTEQAEVVLPLALAEESGGTVMAEGARPMQTSALLAPPAGVPTAAALVEAMARRAGVTAGPAAQATDLSARVAGKASLVAAAAGDPAGPTLLLARQVAHAGCGALTSFGAWQEAVHGEADLDLPAADAARLGLKTHQLVSVRAGGRSVRARVRFSQELPAGLAVLSEGFAQTRALVPMRLDSAGALVPAGGVEFTISPEVATSGAGVA